MMERVRYPCGVRFVPTDEQLVVDYLHNMQKRETLPSDCVKECYHIYGDQSLPPWELLDKDSNDNCFYGFTKLKKSAHHDGIDRTAGCGSWRCRSTKVDDNADGSIEWFKKDLVFETENDGGSGGRYCNGDWVTEEFSLIKQRDDDYVLCKISNSAVEDPNEKKRGTIENPIKIRKSEFEVVINASEEEIQCNHKFPAAVTSALPPDEVGDVQILHREKKMRIGSPNIEELDNGVVTVDVVGNLPFSPSSDMLDERGLADSTDELLQNAFGDAQQRATTTATASPDS